MSGYIGTQPVPQATQTRDAFTATASQTSFATGGYSPGFIDVFLNGVKLAAADYTATNGSEVVLAVGAALNDIIETVAYTTFETSKNATLAQGALADTALQPTGDGSGLTSLTSANLTGALPAIDGSALTSLSSSSLTGALPAIDGSALTGVASLTLVASVATTSGTTIDFTGIPAGTNRITLNFGGVRQNLTTPLLVQLGDSGGIETSGYIASSAHSAGDYLNTSGFNIARAAAGNVTHGWMVLTRITGNQWASGHAATRTTSGSTAGGGGSKTLTGELTQVRLTTTTGGTFNLGNLSISYE